MPLFEDPPPTRSKVIEEGPTLQIRIPLRRLLMFILFLPVWLAGWTYGGWHIGRGLLHQFDWFNFFWMGGWAFGECWAIFWFLRTATGWDLVNASSDCLALKKTALGLGVTRNYRPSDIRNLRFQPAIQKNRGSSPSAIAFDFGPKTVTFGAGLDEAEANQLISLIKSRCTIAEPATPTPGGVTFWQQT
jgi:hypothetical protein